MNTRCWLPTAWLIFHALFAFAQAARTGIFGCRGSRQSLCRPQPLMRPRDESRSPSRKQDATNSPPRAARTPSRWAAKLAGLLVPPQLLILRGDLGTGKTTLVKGIAQALDAAEADEVTSPTFTLIHEYDGVRDGKPVKLYHLDVYRLEGERQLRTLGLDELPHSGRAGSGRVGREVQEHQEEGYRRDSDHFRRRRRAQDYRYAERVAAQVLQASPLACFSIASQPYIQARIHLSLRPGGAWLAPDIPRYK